MLCRFTATRGGTAMGQKWSRDRDSGVVVVVCVLGEGAQIINSRGERAGAKNVDCTVLAYKHFIALI